MPETNASEGSKEPAPPEAPSPPKPPDSPKLSDRMETIAPGSRKITDPEYMRVMAHPARMKVIDYLSGLRLRGPTGATATEISAVTELSPSAMSYHLRMMAKVGIISEGDNQGDGRQRVWKLADRHTTISVEDDAPPSHYEAQSAMMVAIDEQQRANFHKWLDNVRENPKFEQAWATFHNSRLRMTPDDVVELGGKINELVTKYVPDEGEPGELEEEPEDTETVYMSFRLFRDPNF